MFWQVCLTRLTRELPNRLQFWPPIETPDEATFWRGQYVVNLTQNTIFTRKFIIFPILHGFSLFKLDTITHSLYLTRNKSNTKEGVPYL